MSFWRARLTGKSTVLKTVAFGLGGSSPSPSATYASGQQKPKPANRRVGILSYKPWGELPVFGVYVRRGGSFACVFDDKGETLYRDPSKGTRVGEFLENGLPYFRFGDNIEAERIYRWPKSVRDPFFSAKSLDDFMAEWNAADEETREKLRYGLGYDIGL